MGLALYRWQTGKPARAKREEERKIFRAKFEFRWFGLGLTLRVPFTADSKDTRQTDRHHQRCPEGSHGPTMT
jgi:hypothetical protein